jgi:hypothetical protein
MERSFLFAKLPTITKLPQPSVEQEIPGRPAKVGVGFLCLIVRRSERIEKVPARSGWIVAQPDRTPFSGNFRITGYSTGSKTFRTERLDEYVGDCVNSTEFPATSAFSGTNVEFGKH